LLYFSGLLGGGKGRDGGAAGREAAASDFIRSSCRWFRPLIDCAGEFHLDEMLISNVSDDFVCCLLSLSLSLSLSQLTAILEMRWRF